MGWAARTGHKGPGMHGSPLGKATPVRAMSMGALNGSMNTEFRLGHRRAPGANLPHPSGRGKGKWQSQATLDRYRRARDAKRRRAGRSRAANWG